MSKDRGAEREQENNDAGRKARGRQENYEEAAGGGGLRDKELPQHVKLAKIKEDGVGGRRVRKHFAEHPVGGTHSGGLMTSCGKQGIFSFRERRKERSGLLIKRF